MPLSPWLVPKSHSGYVRLSAKLQQPNSFCSQPEVSLMGKCLGRIEYLDYAFELWEQGGLQVVLDNCFSAKDAGDFLRRTYVDPQRLGNVICLFD